MSNAALNPFKNERYKHWKSLEWLTYGVGVVAWTVMCVAVWNPGAHWGQNSHHGWMVFAGLLYGCCMACRLILMRKRSEMSPLPAPSALVTLGLSQGLAGPNIPVHSEHSSDESGSAAR